VVVSLNLIPANVTALTSNSESSRLPIIAFVTKLVLCAVETDANTLCPSLKHCIQLNQLQKQNTSLPPDSVIEWWKQDVTKLTVTAEHLLKLEMAKFPGCLVVYADLGPRVNRCDFLNYTLAH
jgi:hypothetical protein